MFCLFYEAVAKSHAEVFDNLSTMQQSKISSSNPTIHEQAKGHSMSGSMVGESWMDDVMKEYNVAGNR